MKKIPLARPTLGEEEVQAAGAAIRSGWVTQGPRVSDFERDFSSYTGAPHACAVSNCTTALHLALRAVGVRPGDVVITVSHSFIATANAIRHCGAEPVFVDIDPDTLNMSPAALARCLSEDFTSAGGRPQFRRAERLESPHNHLGLLRPGEIGTLRAILLVHQLGMPADISAIQELANAIGVPLVEDAACAIGSEHSLDGGVSWNRIGFSANHLACFSFHPRKVITTGEGGMLTAPTPELDRLLRLLRQHGMGVSDLARHQSEQVIFESYEQSGHNYRLSDIQAAVGQAQLARLPVILAERRRLADLYFSELRDLASLLSFQAQPSYARSNWQSLYARLAPGLDSRAIMQKLQDSGIASRRGVMCAHRETPYLNPGLWQLPESERAQDQGIVLPLYPGLGDEEMDHIFAQLRKALRS